MRAQFLRPTLRRLALVLAAGLLVSMMWASPASAHTVSGPRPGNYRSSVVSVTPPAPGVSVRMVDLGAKVEITNDGASDVVVLGYEAEPYLRIGPRGVFRNVHSAASYINTSVKGGSVPSGVDTNPNLAPQWRKISGGHTARWHDHRGHWMLPTLPPVVQGATSSFHRIAVNHVTFTRDGVTHDVAVRIDWVPGPSSTPWIPVLVVTALIGFIVAIRPRWLRVLALAVVALVVVDIAHSIAYELGRPGSTAARVGQFVSSSFVSVVVWLLAVPTFVGLWRRRVEAVYGAVFVGAMVALVGGATDLSALWKSQLPPAGPAWVTRAEVAVSLGLGAGVAIGALITVFRLARARSGQAAEARDGGWLSVLVAGLDDDEIARIAGQLDADEVLDTALADFARRLAPVDVLGDDAIVFEVDGGSWSIRRLDDAFVATRGVEASPAGTLRTTFPVALQLLGGSVSLADAQARGLASFEGAPSLADALTASLPEQAARRSPDRSSAT